MARQGSVIYPREAVDTLKTQPIGTGPFTVADWVRGDRIVQAEHKTSTTSRVRKPRVIYLTPPVQRLFAWMRRQGPESTGYVFCNSRGRPWQVTAISHHLKRARDRAGLPEDVVAYLCRHSWITRALVNGVAPATVAALAGNSIEMVSQVYSHLADEQEHLAAAAEQAARQPARQK